MWYGQRVNAKNAFDEKVRGESAKGQKKKVEYVAAGNYFLEVF